MISINPVGDASGWFRLYTRSDLADADASRARTQDPDSGSGVILETITSGVSTVYLSPQTIFANAEDTPINNYDYQLYQRWFKRGLQLLLSNIYLWADKMTATITVTAGIHTYYSANS